MREIKFQAWFDEEQKMYDNVVVQFGMVCVNLREDLWHTYLEEKSKVFVRQYIGVKDKNEKEIYEDDVVVAWSQGSKGTFVVKWRQEGSPCWILFPAWQSKQFWNISAAKHTPGKQFISVSAEISGTDKDGYYDDGLEVIGNIYENPELLKQ